MSTLLSLYSIWRNKQQRNKVHLYIGTANNVCCWTENRKYLAVSSQILICRNASVIVLNLRSNSDGSPTPHTVCCDALCCVGKVAATVITLWTRICTPYLQQDLFFSSFVRVSPMASCPYSSPHTGILNIAVQSATLEWPMFTYTQTMTDRPLRLKQSQMYSVDRSLQTGQSTSLSYETAKCWTANLARRHHISLRCHVAAPRLQPLQREEGGRTTALTTPASYPDVIWIATVL